MLVDRQEAGVSGEDPLVIPAGMTPPVAIR